MEFLRIQSHALADVSDLHDHRKNQVDYTEQYVCRSLPACLPIVVIVRLPYLTTHVTRLHSLSECNWANPFCCCIMLIGTVIAQRKRSVASPVLHAITAKPFYESAYHRDDFS